MELEWSGEQKDMPVISVLSVLEKATHVISHRGGDPPLPWPDPKSGPLCSFHFVYGLPMNAARYFRYA
jgi:hypothetical protein